jgi:sugar phosphate isomerase/epimerase
MKWTLNTYQVGQKWSTNTLIEMCVKTGYPFIEFLMDFKQPHGLEWDTPKSRFAATKKKLDAAGLQFGSFTSCQTFHAPEESERAVAVKRVKRVIDMAKEFGCDHVRVLGDRLPKEEPARPEVVDNIAACLEELGDYAYPDIAVSIEMHGSFTDPYYSMQIMNKVDLPNVGLVFNGIWPVGRGEWKYNLPAGIPSIRPFFEMIRPYLTSVHLHEMEKPEVLRYYQEFFALLAESGYEGYVANECAYAGPDPEKVLRMYTALFQVMISA